MSPNHNHWSSPREQKRIDKNLKQVVYSALAHADRSDFKYDFRSRSSTSPTYELKKAIHTGSPDRQTYKLSVEYNLRSAPAFKVYVKPTRGGSSRDQKEVEAPFANSRLKAIREELRRENEMIMPGFRRELEAFQKGTVDLSSYEFRAQWKLFNEGKEFFFHREVSIATEGSPLIAEANVQMRRVHDGRGGKPYSLVLSVSTLSDNRTVACSPAFEQGGTQLSAEVGASIEQYLVANGKASGRISHRG